MAAIPIAAAICAPGCAAGAVAVIGMAPVALPMAALAGAAWFIKSRYFTGEGEDESAAGEGGEKDSDGESQNEGARKKDEEGRHLAHLKAPKTRSPRGAPNAGGTAEVATGGEAAGGSGKKQQLGSFL